MRRRGSRPVLRHLLGAYARDRRGASAVEFALFAPLFLLMLVAVFDIGSQAIARTRLREAMRAGAQAAMSGVSDPQEIRQIISTALKSSMSYDISVTYTNRCGGTAVGAAATSCPGGTPVQSYVTIDMTSTQPERSGSNSVRADSMDVRVR